MIIKWKDEYSVQNREIDLQHQKLFKIINSLLEVMQNKEVDKVEGILKEVLDYADYHFKAEEKFMSSFQFDRLDVHKKIHANFEEKALDLQEKAKKKSFLTSISIFHFLKDWLINHIQIEDQKYVTFKEIEEKKRIPTKKQISPKPTEKEKDLQPKHNYLIKFE